MAAEGSTRAVVTALGANLGIAVAKFVAAAITGSTSMLAEGVHSVADSGNQVLLLVGGKRAERDATDEHPFGYGRARYLYAFIVSVVLFSVGGLFALYEAWHKWQEAEGIHSWQWLPIAVLVVAICLEGYSFRTAILESNKIRGRTNWVKFIRRAKSPELPVILLEDSAALLGLLFALFGVLMTLATDDGRWDAVGTAMIGLLLVCVAAVLAMEMASLLIGEGATPQDLRKIRKALESDGLHRVIHLRTMYVGPDELLVATKVAVGPRETAAEVASAIDDAERRVRAVVPAATLIFIEPDIDRGITPEGGPEVRAARA